MTEQEALNRAREIWGPSGDVFDRTKHPETNWGETEGMKWVGCYGRAMRVYGNGFTWEQAFEEAAIRQAKVD
jgi:hypothetical protein